MKDFLVNAIGVLLAVIVASIAAKAIFSRPPSTTVVELQCPPGEMSVRSGAGWECVPSGDGGAGFLVDVLGARLPDGHWRAWGFIVRHQSDNYTCTEGYTTLRSDGDEIACVNRALVCGEKP